MRRERDHCRCAGALPRRPRDIAAGRSRFSQACHAWQKIRPADRPHFAECPPFSWPRFAQALPACGAPHREPPSLRLPNRAWIAGFACLRTSEPKLRRRFRVVCSVLDTGTSAGRKSASLRFDQVELYPRRILLVEHDLFGKPTSAFFSGHPLARQLFQLRERHIDRAGADVAGVLDHTVEPAVDVENGAFA